MKHHHNFPPSVEAVHNAWQADSLKAPVVRPRGIRGRWHVARENMPFIRQWRTIRAEFRDAGLPEPHWMLAVGSICMGLAIGLVAGGWMAAL